jgi:hypothetical protein
MSWRGGCCAGRWSREDKSTKAILEFFFRDIMLWWTLRETFWRGTSRCPVFRGVLFVVVNDSLVRHLAALTSLH